MKNSRDVVGEIASIKERLSDGGFDWYLPTRLSSLESEFKKFGTSSKELSRYYPIALIACIEAYTRLAIEKLVDAGEPYFSNASKISSSLKLNYDLLSALQGKKVSVGELVSHNLKLSKLEHIDSAMSAVLGTNFLSELATIHDRWEHEVAKKPKKPILVDSEDVYSSVAKTFEMRHIFCHEIAQHYEPEEEQIEACFHNCISFLNAFSELVTEKVTPNRPLTQLDMNMFTGSEYQKTRAEMEKLYTELCEKVKSHDLTKELKLLEMSQAKWELAHESWASFCAGPREKSGSIWPSEYNVVAKNSVELRIKELKLYCPLWLKNLYEKQN